jgi:hypothetical protein
MSKENVLIRQLTPIGSIKGEGLVLPNHSGITVHPEFIKETTGMCPIGSIIAWLKSLAHTPDLPEGWQQCDGSNITDARSPYSGTVTPNLNGNKRYLKGDPASGTTGGATNHKHTFSGTTGFNSASTTPSTGLAPITVAADRHTHTYSGLTSELDNDPPYYTVVWIMRIF